MQFVILIAGDIIGRLILLKDEYLLAKDLIVASEGQDTYDDMRIFFKVSIGRLFSNMPVEKMVEPARTSFLSQVRGVFK